MTPEGISLAIGIIIWAAYTIVKTKELSNKWDNAMIFSHNHLNHLKDANGKIYDLEEKYTKLARELVEAKRDIHNNDLRHNIQIGRLSDRISKIENNYVKKEIWPDCPVFGCKHKVCLSLDSDKCFTHTKGTDKEKTKKIEKNLKKHMKRIINDSKPFYYCFGSQNYEDLKKAGYFGYPLSVDYYYTAGMDYNLDRSKL